jgi:hypothetical protein
LIYRDGSGIASNEKISLEEAVSVARVDEQHQQSIFGVVEGAHDFDQANMLTVFATARSVVGLAGIRDF